MAEPRVVSKSYRVRSISDSSFVVVAIVVVYRELIFESVCGLQLRGQDVHWYIHIWEVTMEIIYLQRKYVVKVDLYFSLLCLPLALLRWEKP